MKRKLKWINQFDGDNCLKTRATQVGAINTDINIKRDGIYTPLHLVAEMGNIQGVKLFIELGYNVNTQDEKNYTPLYYAAVNQNIEVMELLLLNGAEVSLCVLNIAAKKSAIKYLLILSNTLTNIVKLKNLTRFDIDIRQDQEEFAIEMFKNILIKNGTSQDLVSYQQNLAEKYKGKISDVLLNELMRIIQTGNSQFYLIFSALEKEILQNFGQLKVNDYLSKEYITHISCEKMKVKFILDNVKSLYYLMQRNDKVLNAMKQLGSNMIVPSDFKEVIKTTLKNYDQYLSSQYSLNDILMHKKCKPSDKDIDLILPNSTEQVTSTKLLLPPVQDIKLLHDSRIGPSNLMTPQIGTSFVSVESNSLLPAPTGQNDNYNQYYSE